jgi:hypothetical protein
MAETHRRFLAAALATETTRRSPAARPAMTETLKKQIAALAAGPPDGDAGVRRHAAMATWRRPSAHTLVWSRDI